MLTLEEYGASFPAGVTLSFSGQGVGPETRIEGLTIQGFSKTATEGPSEAVQVSEQSQPVIKNCKILGGKGSSKDGGSHGSVGLRLTFASSPDIDSNIIDGGSGSADSASVPVAGSVGVAVDMQSQPTFKRNIIDGGSGTGLQAACGSVGVRWAVATAAPIRDNRISGGTGKASGSAINSTGLYFGVNDDLPIGGLFRCNVIEGGAGTGGQGPVAVRAQNVQQITLDGNRIYAGDGPGGTTVSGLLIANATVIATSNMILGANRQEDPGGTTSYAINLQSGNLELRHNTLHPGRGGSNKSFALRAEKGLPTLIASNNLFLGNIDSGIAAIELASSCEPFDQFRGNLFVGYNSLVNACQGKPATPSVEALEAQFNASVPGVATENRVLRSNCTGDALCINEPQYVAGSTQACLRSVIPGWSDKDTHHAALVGELGGWLLSAGSRCAAVESPYSDPVTTSVDFQGTSRTVPPSRGAHEYDGICEK